MFPERQLTHAQLIFQLFYKKLWIERHFSHFHSKGLNERHHHLFHCCIHSNINQISYNNARKNIVQSGCFFKIPKRSIFHVKLLKTFHKNFQKPPSVRNQIFQWNQYKYNQDGIISGCYKYAKGNAYTPLISCAKQGTGKCQEYKIGHFSHLVKVSFNWMLIPFRYGQRIFLFGNLLESVIENLEFNLKSVNLKFITMFSSKHLMGILLWVALSWYPCTYLEIYKTVNSHV